MFFIFGKLVTSAMACELAQLCSAFTYKTC